MLTCIYITARGMFPMQGKSAHLSQYDLLSQCLSEQTYTDAEILVVDKMNAIPRPEVEHACKRFSGGVRFLRPRMTPWTRMGAFAPNAARNTALAYARGETIVAVDDCYSFKRHYFERIAELARQGQYTVSKLSQADNSVAYPERLAGPFPANQYGGGILSYALKDAIAVNGWDERFDGGSGGDIDFFDRLRRHGVEFITDDGVAVVGHGHGTRTLSHPRCWRLNWNLAQKRRGSTLRGNEPWTPDEMQTWTTCGRQELPRVCSVSGGACDYDGPEPLAITMLRRDYEQRPQFDLAAERRRNALDSALKAGVP